jgi:hypothetical protein
MRYNHCPDVEEIFGRQLFLWHFLKKFLRQLLVERFDRFGCIVGHPFLRRRGICLSSLRCTRQSRELFAGFIQYPRLEGQSHHVNLSWQRSAARAQALRPRRITLSGVADARIFSPHNMDNTLLSRTPRHSPVAALTACCVGAVPAVSYGALWRRACIGEQGPAEDCAEASKPSKRWRTGRARMRAYRMGQRRRTA